MESSDRVATPNAVVCAFSVAYSSNRALSAAAAPLDANPSGTSTMSFFFVAVPRWALIRATSFSNS